MLRVTIFTAFFLGCFAQLVQAGEGANRFDVLAAQANNQANVINAIAGIREKYWLGEIKRGEALIKMQEVLEKKLEVKDKSSQVYWDLKNRRAENLNAAKQKRQDRYERLNAKQEYRTSADISSVWPTIFQHEALQGNADELLACLRTYSPSNSGQLSICYGKSVACMETLHEKLKQDLPGLSLKQRSLLRSYLRELEQELAEPYTDNSNLVAIAHMPRGEQRDFQGTIPVVAWNPQTIEEEKKVVSESVFRILMSEITQAGNNGDRQELVNLAATVRQSNLLTAEQKRSLNQFGSQVYREQISGTRLDTAKAAATTLETI